MDFLRTELSRRNFLTASARGMAGMAVGVHAMHTHVAAIFRGTHGSAAPDSLIPDPLPPDQLRALALVAMDAARGAGAEFADIRIGTQRRVLVYADWYGGSSVAISTGYGVRAWVGGTWCFQYGNVFTADAVAATARSAVAAAQRSAKINVELDAHRRARLTLAGSPFNTDWASVPVVTGAWSIPVAIDPFTVPIDDYQRVLNSLSDVTTPPGVYRSAHALGWNLQWRAETRVFASTAGSLVTQDTLCGGLSTQGLGSLPPDGSPSVFMQIPNSNERCAGFESALRPELPAQLRELHDRVERWRELPFRPFGDVGRFPVVFDGCTMAGAFGNTVSVALDGDRVSGLEADAAGGTFLSPAGDILNAQTPTFSPLVSARVGRRMPSPMAVQWDDDGVVPDDYTVIDRGRVVDYHTTRETAPMLAGWYQRRGRPVRSHGSCVATTPASVPCGTGGHLTLQPGSSSRSIDDLTRDITHGFLIINGGAGGSPGLSEGYVGRRMDTTMVEIQRGRPVARTAVQLRFRTQKLLTKDLLALGDDTTMGTTSVQAWKGIPWQATTQYVTAPAALAKEVEVY